MFARRRARCGRGLGLTETLLGLGEARLEPPGERLAAGLVRDREGLLGGGLGLRRPVRSEQRLDERVAGLDPVSPEGKRELALAYLVIFVALTCLGGGKWSVDAAWRKK